MTSTEKENLTMRIFGAIGMLLIAAGHLKISLFEINGLFPYYSFHVYIFLFIAGYFYKPSDEGHLLKFIARKAKKLLLPYFILNLIYGLISTALCHFGFTIGQKISLYNLFVAPFLGGHQFMLNFPAWFVPALFVAELVYILGRIIAGFLFKKILKLKDDAFEILILIVTLLIGIGTVYLAIGGHVWGYYKDLGRILIMLPGISFGRSYKALIEGRIKGDIITKIICIIAVSALQFFIVQNTNGLNFSTVWVTSFSNGPIIPFVTVVTGIIFWYNISGLIAKIKPVSKIFAHIGRHTYEIMSDHIFVLFIINSVCYLLFKYCGIFTDLEKAAYMSDVSYLYPYAGQIITPWINLVLCIALPCTLFSTRYIKRRNKTC